LSKDAIWVNFVAQEISGGVVDVVKMDIEGAEIEVIASLDDDQIKRVGQWAIEFHDFMGMMTGLDVERITVLGFH
jgi:Methyltransferase FkbM domain